jgi:hypothetical protein
MALNSRESLYARPLRADDELCELFFRRAATAQELVIARGVDLLQRGVQHQVKLLWMGSKGQGMALLRTDGLQLR